MSNEKYIELKNTVHKLIEEKKYNSAINVAQAILLEFEKNQFPVSYEGQLIFTYLGFSYMQIGELEKAEQLFLEILKTEECLGRRSLRIFSCN